MTVILECIIKNESWVTMKNVSDIVIVKMTTSIYDKCDQDNNWKDNQMVKSSINNKKNIVLIAHIIILAAEMKNTIKVALIYITIERTWRIKKLETSSKISKITLNKWILEWRRQQIKWRQKQPEKKWKKSDKTKIDYSSFFIKVPHKSTKISKIRITNILK